MEPECKSSIGGGGDPSNENGWDIGIDQCSYFRAARTEFNQSNAAYEGKKLYSENLRKYKDVVGSGDNFKPTNDKFDDITFRTSNSCERCTTDNASSSATFRLPSSDGHCAANNNLSGSTSDKQDSQQQEWKQTSCKSETTSTKNKSTLFFDPKRIFADNNKAKHETEISDVHSQSSDTQSDGELLDLREQTLRFDAKIKKKLEASVTTDSTRLNSVRKMKNKSSPKSEDDKSTNGQKTNTIKENSSPYKGKEKCSCKANLSENITNDVKFTFSGDQEKPNWKGSKVTFGCEETSHGRDGFDQDPKPQSSNPSDKINLDSGNRKKNMKTESESYSRRKKKVKSKSQDQQQKVPENNGKSNRGGRSKSKREWDQEAEWPGQTRVDDERGNAGQMGADNERRNVNVEGEVREEAADGSGDALQQLFFGILKTLVWFLSFLFFLFLVLLSFTINIAKRWIVYTIVFLKMMVGWIRRKDTSHNGGQNGGSLSFEDIQGMLNLGPSENIELPTEGKQAVQRLLKCNAADPYAVLGVTSDATDDTIKRYYRKQCMMVHPDKNTMTGAEEAFKILGSAFEIIGEPTKRAEFHRAITESAQKEMFHKEFAEQLRKMQEVFEERANTIRCLVCGGKHLRYLTDRSPYSARYCAKHDTRHHATDGDIWAESSHLGFRWHYFTCTGHQIYDVTEWAKCQDMRLMQSNAHEVRYRFDTRRQHRQRTAPPPPNFEDAFWDEFLRQTCNMDQPTRNQSANPNNQQRKQHKKKHRKKKGF
ncbi:dnaJ homolog dnj-5-like [Anneissia japonica]|uniref:dnaJ homolog dnj-5-like n=1 Tax=Anneissia japonica TaxID=1529436 RepID=UPI0014256ECF|nr:dnaJ homolog dnj-5-like [Anneissia japonica]